MRVCKGASKANSYFENQYKCLFAHSSKTNTKVKINIQLDWKLFYIKDCLKYMCVNWKIMWFRWNECNLPGRWIRFIFVLRTPICISVLSDKRLIHVLIHNPISNMKMLHKYPFIYILLSLILRHYPTASK